MKNEVLIQSQVVSLRNLENQIRQLATALNNISQRSLPSNIDDLRREENEHCKVINLRSKNDIHILVGIPKRRVELVSAQKETQIEKKAKQYTF